MKQITNCKLRLFLFLCIVFLVCSVPSPAQVPHFRKHTLPPEYKSFEVEVIEQDRRGFIWLGTSEGLLRYDGFEYKLFQQHTEAGNHVTAIFEDDSTHLWIGYKNGRISRLQHDRIISFSPEEGVPKVPITGFATDDTGNLWYSTYGEGIYVKSGAHVYNINRHDGLTDDFVYDIVGDKKGILAGSDNGLAICQFKDLKKSVTRLSVPEGLPDNIVTAIERGIDGSIWLGTESHGVCKYDAVTNTCTKLKGEWQHGKITSLIAWEDALWAGTAGKGIIELDKRGNSLQLRSQAEPMASISDLMRDNEGNAWVANGTSSVFSSTRNFSLLSSLPESHVQSLISGSEGLLYSTGSDLYIFNPASGSVTRQALPESIPEGVKIISLYQDSIGHIWLGTFDHGAFRLDLRKKEALQVSQQHGLVNNNVLSITGDGDTIWLATLGGATRLVYKPVPKEVVKPAVKKPAPRKSRAKEKPRPPDPRNIFTFQNFTADNGLSSNFIYKAFIDSKGRVWFATDGKGVSVLEGTNFETYTLGEEARDNIVYSITEDAKGVIWASTAGNNVFILRENKFELYEGAVTLHDRNISSLIADDEGNLLVVSKEGIDVINADSKTSFFHGDAFGISLIDPDLNAVASDSLGNIWIGTQRGIIKYRSVEKRQLTPVTRINSISVFLKEVKGDSTYAHDQNHISFDYVAFWYHDPREITYQIKLDGHDENWITTRNRSITYPNLQPGHYTFNVRSSANGEFDNIRPLQYSFTILTPFYNEWWFYAAIAVLLGALIFLIVRTRELRLRRAERLHREKVQFQLETLRSQVNPHFLFNSFNTLASVIEEDQSGAVEYVEKLSDFYRNILLHRQQDVISLGKELELIENYYFLQLKRYKQNFVMELNVPAGYHHKRIPPLTLQLLVENAVKHNIISTGAPLIIEIYISSSDYLAVKNNLQRKSHHEPSTGMGLNNITNRFKILTPKPVHIKEDEESFTVFIPLLD